MGNFAVSFKNSADLATGQGVRKVRRLMSATASPTGKDFPIYELDHGFMFGTRPVFGFFEDMGTLIVLEESSDAYNAQQVFKWILESSSVISDPAFFPGSFCPLYSVWAQNIWHWVTEHLPKVLVMEDAGFDGFYIVPPIYQFVDSLKILGIPEQRIFPWRGKPCVFERLVYCGQLSGHRAMAYKPTFDRLRDRLMGAVSYDPAQKGKRLYIVRHVTRTMCNHAEFTAMVEEFGFIPVTMENHTFAEQLSLAAHAEAMIGIHGAGMLFSMMMPPKSLLFELFSAHYANACMFEIVRHLEHDYVAAVVGQTPSHAGPPDSVLAPLDMCRYQLRRHLPPRG